MSDDEEGGAGAPEILDESPFRWKKLFADVTEIDRQPHMYYGGWYWIRQPDGNYGCNYVMVLDDGRCFIGVEDIMGRAGVSFRRLPEVKPEPRWHAPFVKDFVRGGSSNPDEDNVYDLCLNAFRSYIDYEEPGAAMLMALYTIQTYLMPIFDTTAYILITGPKRSGKSKNFDVAEQLVFNPVRAVNMSVSSIFRIIEDWQATLLIDESDLDLPEKAAGIRTILLSGYKRGLFVLRTEKTTKDRHFVERYDVFGPKMIVAPQGVAETMREQMLLDRCIPITMQRTTDEQLAERPLLGRHQAPPLLLRAEALARGRRQPPRDAGQVAADEQGVREVEPALRHRRVLRPLRRALQLLPGKGQRGVLGGGVRVERGQVAEVPHTPVQVGGGRRRGAREGVRDGRAGGLLRLLLRARDEARTALRQGVLDKS
jgi:hypothetical protein